MRTLMIVILEYILGYLLQLGSYVVGIHAFAHQKLDLMKAGLVTIISAGLTYIIRNVGVFNFGVHTLLMMLIINAACVFICRVPLRKSILGSIVMMIIVVAGELIDMGVARIFYEMDEISVLLEDAVYKAAIAVPGNVVLAVVAVTLYFIMKNRPLKAQKNEAGK